MRLPAWPVATYSLSMHSPWTTLLPQWPQPLASAEGWSCASQFTLTVTLRSGPFPSKRWALRRERSSNLYVAMQQVTHPSALYSWVDQTTGCWNFHPHSVDPNRPYFQIWGQTLSLTWNFLWLEHTDLFRVGHWSCLWWNSWNGYLRMAVKMHEPFTNIYTSNLKSNMAFWTAHFPGTRAGDILTILH